MKRFSRMLPLRFADKLPLLFSMFLLFLSLRVFSRVFHPISFGFSLWFQPDFSQGFSLVSTRFLSGFLHGFPSDFFGFPLRFQPDFFGFSTISPQFFRVFSTVSAWFLFGFLFGFNPISFRSSPRFQSDLSAEFPLGLLPSLEGISPFSVLYECSSWAFSALFSPANSRSALSIPCTSPR